MTNERRISSDESTVFEESSASLTSTKQRKKRKWDEPALPPVSSVPTRGLAPLGNMEIPSNGTLPSAVPFSDAIVTSIGSLFPQALPACSLPQHLSATVQKFNQPKVQEELIAREIVINDAEPSLRYKLTKRQTQEEIQSCSGAVVITRGRYRPSNQPPDGEKPLYLHISAGAHLLSTVERIKAVDLAAAMVEQMLMKDQSPFSLSSNLITSSNVVPKVTEALSTCVFLGFHADPSWNIVQRIRGPNDQYINHIMTQTGVTVLLKGHVPEDKEIRHEARHHLHLFLSSNNPRSLENAKLLAENLLDTIASEFGVSRVSSSKIYGAVPPPLHLLNGHQDSKPELTVNSVPYITLNSNSANSSSTALVSSASVVRASETSQGTMFPSQSQGCGPSQQMGVCYSHHSLTNGTSYNGYGGIYPHATPLQQVTLALRQSHCPATVVAVPTSTLESAVLKSDVCSSPENKNRQPQKRKFQEMPVVPKEPYKFDQGFEFSRSSHRSANGMLAPGTSEKPASALDIMRPPPPRTIPASLPPKFTPSRSDERTARVKVEAASVPDTLVKLMEYGEEDDDDDEDNFEDGLGKSKSVAVTAPRPFWAV